MRLRTTSQRSGRLPRSLILTVTLVLTVAACDWPMFGYGPDRTRSSPDTSIGKSALAGSMALDWTTRGPGYPTNENASPAVANGVVYIGLNELQVFDAGGKVGCSGSPKTCTPLWTEHSTIGGSPSPPTVANGVVYVADGYDTLFAFDAAGKTNCSGAPKICAPLWYASVTYPHLSSPAVVNGVVYVTAYGTLYAFDAAGKTNCSGAPKICAPLWTASGASSDSPAVANGKVYVGESVFDAAGKTNCSSSSKTCAPLWVNSIYGQSTTTPAVANGVVYMGTRDGLFAFDAAGNTNCSGSLKTCAPLWTAATGGTMHSSPALANRVVYIGSDDHKLYAFDAAGNTNCSGSPRTCAALWTAPTFDIVFSSPAVANGVVYVGSEDHNLYGFDANGTTKCSGTPKTCAPLWTATTGDKILTSPAVANGFVYVGSNDGKLYAFGLEKIPPTTAIVVPSDGATLAGTTAQLDASASDDVQVSRVEFHLTASNSRETLIGLATPTTFGWVYFWNTKSVPNGSYTLNSVATDPAGNIGRSTNVHITVRN
jgi:outer membrane protein assembly factor BamB